MTLNGGFFFFFFKNLPGIPGCINNNFLNKGLSEEIPKL